jgi:hypothetical protein
VSEGIRDVIVEDIKALLEEHCQQEVSSDDQGYVDEVHIGPPKSDPGTTHGNHVYICYNNPFPKGPREWWDEVARMTSDQVPFLNLSRGYTGLDMAEIGATGENWWRKFSMEIRSHFAGLGYTQDQARQYHMALVNRVKQTLRENVVTGSDDFGELVTDVYGKIRWEESAESGSGTTWIWHTFVGLQVLTGYA